MGQSRVQVLGRDVRGPIGAEGLDAVPWSHSDTDATVEFTTNELTALCPITGQPDFYELKLYYRPKGSLIESKSLKLYLWSFRNDGIFYERAVNRILDDLVTKSSPKWMRVVGDFNTRGGIKSVITAVHGKAPATR